MQKGGVCQNWKHTPDYVKCVKCVSSGGPLKVDNVLITKGDEMANVLKKFFVSVFTKEPLAYRPGASSRHCIHTLKGQENAEGPPTQFSTRSR